MKFITNKKVFFSLWLGLLALGHSSVRPEFNFPGTQKQFSAPGPMDGGMGSGVDDFGPMGDLGDMDALFNGMDPQALEDMIAAADKMLAENPELAKQMEAMASNLGFGPEGLPQPTLPPTKTTDMPQPKKSYAQPKPQKKASEKESETDLSQYSGYKRVLIDPKESPKAKNQAFSQFQVAFSSVYEQLKGYGRMTDPEEDHLLIPVREEVLKFMQGEPCQVNVAIITISDNFSDKAHTKERVPLYKQLFTIFDALEEALIKIKKFAGQRSANSDFLKKNPEFNDQPTAEEVDFIDSNDLGSINQMIDLINENLSEVKKLLSDTKLKAQFEKHLKEKGYKPYSKRSTPYWPKYTGRASAGQKGSGKSGGSKSGDYRSSGGYPRGYDYDDYDDYYKNYGLPKKMDSQGNDEGLTAPVQKKEYQEPKKEIADLFNEIASLADMRLFDPGSGKLVIEGLYQAIGKVNKIIIEQKTYPQELVLFLYEIHGLKPKASVDQAKEEKTKVEKTTTAIDPKVAKPFVESFPLFYNGVEVLNYFSRGQLPYQNQPLATFPGILPPDFEVQKKVDGALKVCLGLDQASASPFSIPAPGQNNSEGVFAVLDGFFTATREEQAKHKALEKCLGQITNAALDIKTGLKKEETGLASKFSPGQEFTTLTGKLRSAISSLGSQIQTSLNTIKAFNNASPIPFFDGIGAVKEDDWGIFKNTKELEAAMVSISQLIIKYKLQFPVKDFQSFDAEIINVLEKVKDSYEHFADQFTDLQSEHLEIPPAGPPGGAVPAMTPIRHLGINTEDKRDCTREFLIALWGAGREASVPTDKTAKFSTLGFYIKSVGVLNDNIRELVRGEKNAAADQLHKALIEKAATALSATCNQKQTVAQIAQSIASAIGSVYTRATELLSGLF